MQDLIAQHLDLTGRAVARVDLNRPVAERAGEKSPSGGGVGTEVVLDPLQQRRRLRRSVRPVRRTAEFGAVAGQQDQALARRAGPRTRATGERRALPTGRRRDAEPDAGPSSADGGRRPGSYGRRRLVGQEVDVALGAERFERLKKRSAAREC